MASGRFVAAGATSAERQRLRAAPVTNPPDDRSPAAKAYQWATRIMVASLEMVVPGLLGLWVDRWLGTVILFTVVGFAGGTWMAVAHLIRMTRADEALRSGRE